MANNSSLSKRAALRQQQEMEERNKRTRRILTAGAALIAVVVVTVLAIVIVQALGKSSSIAAGEQLTPPNATEKFGILANGAEPTADKPHLVIYQDYQCPWCALYEEDFGPAITELVDEGKITVEYRTAYFLDGGVEFGPSRRAALAAAAADEVGYHAQYNATIYANHAESATAYPDSELRDTFAQMAGMTGDDLRRFQELYDSRAFTDFTQAAGEQFSASGLTGTPAYMVSGQQLQLIDSTTQPVIDTSASALFEVISNAWETGGRSNDD